MSRIGFTGLDKAKIEARRTITIVEAQLRFLDKAECLREEDQTSRENLLCTADMDRASLIRTVEQELAYLQKLPPKEKSMEVRPTVSEESHRSFIADRFSTDR